MDMTSESSHALLYKEATLQVAGQSLRKHIPKHTFIERATLQAGRGGRNGCVVVVVVFAVNRRRW